MVHRYVVTPTENAVLPRGHARGATEFLFFPESGHCFQGRAGFLSKHLVRDGCGGDRR